MKLEFQEQQVKFTDWHFLFFLASLRSSATRATQIIFSNKFCKIMSPPKKKRYAPCLLSLHLIEKIELNKRNPFKVKQFT